MSYYRKIVAGLVKDDITNFVGEVGNIFFNIDTGELRLSDGNTPGGLPIYNSQGNGIKITGSVGTSSLLPTPYTGLIGDTFLTIDTGDFYIWDGNVWINTGPIAGPLGYTGSIGFTGSASTVRGYTGSQGRDGAYAARGYTGSSGTGYFGLTSLSPITINTGFLTFLVNEPYGDTAFSVGARVRASFPPNPDNFIEGIIISYVDNTLIVNSSLTQGFGTYSSWDFNIAGEPGAGGGGGGIPSGGTTGQVLTKNSNTNYDTAWTTISGGGGGNGYTGSKGDNGSAGSTGYTGSKGEPGSAGSNGTVGYTGSASTVGGYTGSKGDVGFAGSLPSGLISNNSNLVTLQSGYDLVPATNGLQDLGTGTYEFRNLYLGNSLVLGTGPNLASIKPTVDGIKIVDEVDGLQEVNVDTLRLGPTATSTLLDSTPQGVFSINTNGVNTIEISSTVGLELKSSGSGIKFFDGTIQTTAMVRGYTGSQGNNGDIGYTGSASTVVGYTGSAGQDGASVARGYTGSASEFPGYTGSAGETGYTGSKGDQGAQGVSITLKGTVAAVVNLPASGNTQGDSYVVTASGDLWVWNGTSWTDVGRIVGYTGSQGVGYTGSKGDAGSTGYSGSASTVSGPTGYTGSQGADGGFVGRGYTGSRGDVGYTGSQGVGYTGSQGAKGDTGTAGSAGTQGDTGFTGSKGIGYTGSASTIAGYTGSKGDRGDVGYTGSQGVGYTGSASTVVGYTGSAGGGGVAATISIGTVAAGAPGSTPIVTNSGTSNAATLNFTIPTGYSGSAGPAGTASGGGAYSFTVTFNGASQVDTVTNLPSGWSCPTKSANSIQIAHTVGKPPVGFSVSGLQTTSGTTVNLRMGPPVGTSSAQTFGVNYDTATNTTVFNITGITVGNFSTVASGTTIFNVFF